MNTQDVYIEKKELIGWIVKQHETISHKYDSILPYEFHLRVAATVYSQFKDLIDPGCVDSIELAVWGHDLLEDTHVSYNDIKKVLGEDVAEIVYAVTNEKGRNRTERANSKYYQGIRDTPGASFVKLCDRIANVKYSKMMGSTHWKMYYRENEKFMAELGDSLLEGGCYNKPLLPMVEYLNKLFKEY